MELPKRTWEKWLPWMFFTLAFILYTANSGGIMLYALDEAKNAGCAREMLLTDEFVVPVFNGEMRTDKPPLHYYHIILAYKVFGINEFAARFFSALYGAFTVLLVFLFARKQWGQPAAFWSATSMIASVHLAFQFHFAVPDPYLIFYLTLALFCFYEAYTSKQKRYLWGLYLGVAMATLAKGPVAIGLPGLIFLVFLIAKRDLKWSTLKQLRPLSGALLVAALVLPWYALVWHATEGEWVREFLFTHNFNRYADTMESHRGYGVLPILIPLVGMLPLGVFLPAAFASAWRARKNLVLFSLVSIGVLIGFFVFSKTYLPNYTVPAYPFLALLLGRYLALATEAKPRRWSAGLWVFLGLSLLVPAGLYFALTTDPTLAAIASSAWWFCVLPVGAILALWWKDSPTRSAFVLGCSGVVTILVVYFAVYPALDRWNPVARTLPDMDPARPVVYYKIMNPAYIFYMEAPVPGTQTVKELRAYLSEHPDAYVISRIGWRRDFAKIEGLQEWKEVKDILEIPTTLILTYEPQEPSFR